MRGHVTSPRNADTTSQLNGKLSNRRAPCETLLDGRSEAVEPPQILANRLANVVVAGAPFGLDLHCLLPPAPRINVGGVGEGLELGLLFAAELQRGGSDEPVDMGGLRDADDRSRPF